MEMSTLHLSDKYRPWSMFHLKSLELKASQSLNVDTKFTMLLMRLSSPRHSKFYYLRCFSSSKEKVPFYGLPRRLEDDQNDDEFGITSRLSLFVHHATRALWDPTRAESVAIVGELTSEYTLQRLQKCMNAHSVGQRILNERPIVSQSTIPYQRLLESAKEQHNDSSPETFGQAYGKFLLQHGFDPDGRDPIRYLKDKENAYILLRYRQCHDFWHVLYGLPPTVLGELALKHVELWQTGLPLAALSALGGRFFSLEQPRERLILDEVYEPWARRTGQAMPYGTLLNVYYEEEWETPLEELRARLKIEPAPEIDNL